MNPPCQCHSGPDREPALFAVNADEFAELASQSSAGLYAASKAAGAAAKGLATAFATGGGLQTHFQVTATGDTLASSSFASGSSGDIVVRGNIGGIPYELHINVALDGEEVAVTLHLKKPIEIGPYTWRFKLRGILRGAGGDIMSASGITPSSGDVQAAGIGWWCAVKCGGATILPTLLVCLPALAGGPAPYVACVTGKLGAGDAAKIALCIATKCVN